MGYLWSVTFNDSHEYNAFSKIRRCVCNAGFLQIGEKKILLRSEEIFYRYNKCRQFLEF